MDLRGSDDGRRGSSGEEMRTKLQQKEAEMAKIYLESVRECW